MTNQPDRFIVDEEAQEIIWAIDACARVILSHPEISGRQISLTGQLIESLDALPGIVPQQPISIGLRLERGGGGLTGGSYIQINTAPAAIEVVSGWWEHDPESGSDHRSSTLCRCDSSGLHDAEGDLLLLPNELTQMIDEGAQIYVEEEENSQY